MLSLSEKPLVDKVALVTGASSGIGAKTAELLARLGARVVVGARRTERLDRLCFDIMQAGGDAQSSALDVGDAQSCRVFIDRVLERHNHIDILINNAGLARGFENVVDSDERDWREMVEANVMGLMRMTRLSLPAMLERGGDIVHIGSVAGLQPYPRGAAYCATKAAVEAFASALRQELLGTAIRQLVIEPGMVETEFSEVRFHGDRERAKAVYRGLLPLSPEDVAECIAFALTRPAHVSIQTLLLMPTAQVTATSVARSD
jgi:NADP-dependent 3-hydroxy acid dehydrogenase YdfG